MATSERQETAIRRDEDAKIERAARIRNVVSNQGAGFMIFIRQQGVVGLAIGLAIGAAAGASVKAIVDNLVNPLVALITQGVNLNNLKWILEKATHAHPEVAIGWGAILSSLITLLATAFVVYVGVHYAKLDRIDKKKEDAK